MPTTKYLWNDITDTVVMEKDGAGNTTAVYQSDPVPFGRLRSMRRGGTTYNYHYDGRGNTTYLTDQTGRKTDAYTYDAFGTQRTATGNTENPYRFGGQHGYQYNESTGDYYVRARVYEPKRGRWRSRDPIPLSVEWSNPYLYSGGRPLTMNDPSGALSQKTTPFAPPIVASVGAAGGSLASPPPVWVGRCGSYIWVTRWITDPKKESNGYILQKVRRGGKIADCNDNPGVPVLPPIPGVNTKVCTDHFYVEVWRVANGGKVYADAFADKPKQLDPYDVFAQFGFTKETFGGITKTAEAYFVPMSNVTKEQKKKIALPSFKWVMVPASARRSGSRSPSGSSRSCGSRGRCI